MTTVPQPEVRHVLFEDFGLALLVALRLVAGSGVSREDDFSLAVTSPGNVLPAPYALLLAVAGSLPLTFRRFAPPSVLTLTVSASLAYQALGLRPEPLPIAVLVAIYTVAVLR